MRILLLSATALLLAAGCTKVNEQALVLEAAQQALCTKDTLSYSTDVAPIIQANCLDCHNAAEAQGGIVLATYADVKGMADAGLLMGTVKHQAGYQPMPKNRPKLKDCEIRALQVWVDQGAQNN